jgi:hypothetical protein
VPEPRTAEAGANVDCSAQDAIGDPKRRRVRKHRACHPQQDEQEKCRNEAATEIATAVAAAPNNPEGGSTVTKV